MLGEAFGEAVVSEANDVLCLPGMSTFSTKGGLYERAARRFGLADGMRLFSYAFFDKQRLEALVGCCRV